MDIREWLRNGEKEKLLTHASRILYLPEAPESSSSLRDILKVQ